MKKYFDKYLEDVAKMILNIKDVLRLDIILDDNLDFVRQSVKRCVKMLDNNALIDMFERARQDSNVSLEVTLATLRELVKKEKIEKIALSEMNVNIIRKAIKLTKIIIVKIEISLFYTNLLINEIVETCANYSILVIA